MYPITNNTMNKTNLSSKNNSNAVENFDKKNALITNHISEIVLDEYKPFVAETMDLISAINEVKRKNEALMDAVAIRDKDEDDERFKENVWCKFNNIDVNAFLIIDSASQVLGYLVSNGILNETL
jgi:hypothetical protein